MKASLCLAGAIACLLTGCRVGQDENAERAAASLRMIDLPNGRFIMGSNAAEGLQQGTPTRPVAVHAFRISATEVTFNQYDRFTSATGRPRAQDEGWGRGARPVVNVTGDEIQDYIDWLNRGTGRRFRLPTEAEWEYAARGGGQTPFFWGDAPDPAYANADGVNGPDRWPATAPVASFRANRFGLYDTAGNAWERVADCFHFRFVGAPSDGSAWMTPNCAYGVARGGYFGSINRGIRVTSRAGVGQQFRSAGLGFRLAEDSGADR